MRLQQRLFAGAAGLALAILTGGAAASAQQAPAQPEKQEERVRKVIVEDERVMVSPGPDDGTVSLPRAPGGHVMAPPPGTAVFVSSEMSFDHKVVTNAPYSAEAVTETVQTLADGNRIVRKNSASVYRDSQGRTRRDQTLGSFGPFAAAGDPPQTFFINDPVAGVNYILDPRTRTARKLTLPRFVLGKPGELPAGVQIERRARGEKGKNQEEDIIITAPVPAPPPGVRLAGPPHPLMHGMHHTEMFVHSKEKADVKKESLGKRQVGVVEAEGTSHTLTIAAGEIGNEQPINVVTET